MKLNNKGFALTSIIYMLIVLFLMIMLLILANLAQRKVVLDKIKSEVKENLNQGGLIAKNTYTVTFDPTVGQINQTTKQVTYGEPYGELPTPTREGYVFRGWRGKNMFDKNSEAITKGSYIKDDETVKVHSSYSLYQINIMPNTTYTIKNSGGSAGLGYVIYDINGTMLTGENYNNRSTVTFTSPANASYMKYSVMTMAISNYYDTDIFQIEEGNTATSYEAYQEYTSDTIVTRGENHTLYAIWEPVYPTYTLTLDPNGGTLSETTKQVSYHSTYGELPTPTREGYTFMGWNGKNLLNLNEYTYIYNATFDGNKVSYDSSSVSENVGDGIMLQKYLNGTYISNMSYRALSIGIVKYPFTKDSGFNQLMIKLNTNHRDGSIRTNILDLIDGNTYTFSYRIDSFIPEQAKATISNIEIEEGNVNNEFEPYYITSDTLVVRRGPHTLKAIWKANS